MQAARSGKLQEKGCRSICSSVFCKPQSSLGSDLPFSIPAGLQLCMLTLCLQSSALKAIWRNQLQNNCVWNRNYARPSCGRGITSYFKNSFAMYKFTCRAEGCNSALSLSNGSSTLRATYYGSCQAAPHCSVYRALCSAPVCHDFLVFIVKNEAQNMLQMCRALFPFSDAHCRLCWLTSHLCSSARLVRADAMVTAQAACGLGHFLLLCSQFQVSFLYSPEIFF